MDKNKKAISLTSIKEQLLNNPLFSKSIPIILSVWILSLTAYYCINTPWLSLLSSGRPDSKQLVAETLKFHWVPVFLSRFPYVFYALILNFIALLVGNRILRWLKVDFVSNINRIVFSIPLGWGIYSIGIFYLGISGLLYKEAVYCFIALLGVLSILEIKRFFSEWRSLATISRFKIEKTDLIFLPILISFFAFQLVLAFSPVWSGSALTYHMTLPKLYANHHALVHIPGFLFSTFPAHTDMLYLLGLIVSGDTLSKLFSFSISSMFLISIFTIGNRYLSRRVGYLAAFIMMLSMPCLFFPLFSEPWVDVAFGLFSLLGVYAFFMWIEERPVCVPRTGGREGYLYLSIICCAFAAATKIQGLFFVLLFFVGFLVYALHELKIDRHFLKKLVWCILAVGIIALPWYIRCWWLTGDPVFPFLYDYLGAKHWNEYSNECLSKHILLFGESGTKSLSNFFNITNDLFFGGFGLTSISPIIGIFLVLSLITLRNRNLSACNAQAGKLIRYFFIIILVYYIFLTFTTIRSRYFYLGCASVSIIIAHFIETVWTKYFLARISIILCIVTFSVASLVVSAVWIEGPFFAGLGVLDRRQFLNENHYRYLRDPYKASMWVNENLPQDSKILTGYLQVYYLEREYVRVNPAFQGVLDFGRIKDAPTFLKSINELGITHLIYGSNVVLGERPREFLVKCVSELLESGKMIKLKQIGECIIYSVEVPPGYFVLDGNTIRFCDESQRKYLVTGWSSAEEWGTWSEGAESVILVNLGKPKDYTMLIKATGFSVPGKQQSVSIYLDGNLLGKHTFTQPTTYFEDFEMKIPSVYIKEGNQRIRFVYSFSGSPAEHGIGPDVRQLAMGVSSIEFK